MLINNNHQLAVGLRTSDEGSSNLFNRLANGNYRHILFDWDGTVVGSHMNIVKAIVSSAHEICDVYLDHLVVASHVGLGLNDIFVSLLGKKAAPALPALLDAFTAKYGEACANGEELVIDGVPALLEFLRQRGIRMSVASNKRTLTLAASVNSSKLANYFDHLLDAEHYAPKPDPAMCRFIERYYDVNVADILMIGDSSVDRAFAWNAGCDFLCLSAEVGMVSDGTTTTTTTTTAVDVVAAISDTCKQD